MFDTENQENNEFSGESIAEIDAEIEAHNASLGEPGGDDEIVETEDNSDLDENADENSDEAAADSEENSEEAGDDAETEETEETDEPAEEDAPDAAAAAGAEIAADDEIPPFEFTPDADDETFETEAQLALARYELPADVQVVIDRRAQQIEEIRQRFEPVERAGAETVIEIATAVDSFYDTRFDDSGVLVPNVRPLLTTLKKRLEREFPALIDEELKEPSRKYANVPVIFEKLKDLYDATPAAIITVHNFLQNKVPLPEPARRTPEGIDERLADAFAELPDVKRFEIESLAREVAELEREKENRSYYAGEELPEKSAKLAAEITMLERSQKGINEDKARNAWREREDERLRVEFFETVAATYKTEMIDTLDTFAKVLAPKLTFIGKEAQLSMARNITTRIANSLSFFFDDQFEIHDDPFADVYAKQLIDEGVKFNFVEAREMLKEHFRLTHKILELERGGYPPLSIQRAKLEKQQLVAKIKAKENEIVGQLGAKYVAAASGALKEKTEQLAGKKQIARKVVLGTGAQGKAKPANPSIKDVDKEIEAHNRKVTQAIARGDLEELENEFAG